jgi:DNA-directed RNA polymerase subunit RPC12/RpoP
METKSILTCPYCNHSEELEMPLDFCQYFYICKNCGKTITPKKGDCCVFCSYGTNPCPSIQEQQNCC